MPFIPGYEYVRTLGEGATARVHHCRQTATGMDVAVKVGRRPLDERTRKLFDSERRLMARVSAHPFVLGIIDAGTTPDGRGYIVLEYAPGGSYGQIIRRWPLRTEQALDLGVRLAGALETAHRAGIIHRDVKPANILVTTMGLPALSDFGVSAGIDGSRRPTGFSLPWAPPEVVEGGEGTERSDVYSLAATIHAAVVGASPYEHVYRPRSPQELETLILSRDAPHLDGSQVPPAVSRTLAVAMARKPDDRYPTALSFARALQAVQTSCFGRATPLIVKGEPRYPQGRQPAPAPAPSRMASGPERIRCGHAAAAAIAIAIIVTLCLAFALEVRRSRGSDGWGSATIGDGGMTVSPSPRTSTDVGSEPEPVPSPTNLVGRYSGDTVTFTWTNPDPRRGDAYAWTRVDSGSSESVGAQIVDATSVSMAGVDEDQLCLQVSIVRSDRRTSQHPTTACAVRR